VFSIVVAADDDRNHGSDANLKSGVDVIKLLIRSHYEQISWSVCLF